MDFKKLLWDWIPNAEWDLFKWVIKQVAWAGMIAALVGFIQKIRSGVLDWWVLGTVFFASPFILYMTSEGPRSMTNSVAVSSSAPPAVVPPLAPPANSAPMRLVEGWREKVKLSVLKIPRPCTIRVAAAPGSVDIRSDLHFVIKESAVMEGITGRVLIPPCDVLNNLQDSEPDSYVDRPSDAPSGTIIINAADRKVAELIFSMWEEELGPKVKVGKTLPSDGPADLIYIQVGPR